MVWVNWHALQLQLSVMGLASHICKMIYRILPFVAGEVSDEA